MLSLNEVLGWSFPFFRTRRLEVRISWLLLVWMLFDAISFASAHAWHLVAAAGLVIPVCMLLHSLAHVWAARWVGGAAPVTTLSPLNDQTDLSLPTRPWAHFLTGMAGPAMSLALAGGAVIGIAASAGGAMSLRLGWPPVHAGDDKLSQILAYFFQINFLVALFNLLACAPFDGWRWWRGLLWAFMPMAKAVRVALTLGMISAVLLIVVAAWLTSFLLLFMGIAALLATIADRQAVANGHDPVFQADPTYAGQAPQSAWSRQRSARKEEARAREEVAEQEILDRLLAKVSNEGLPSLTAAERKQLQQISQRQKERAAEG